MSTTAKPPKKPSDGGKTKTKTKAIGINVSLLAPPDKLYLCQKICVSKKFGKKKYSKAAKLGYYLSPQLMVDSMIMLDYHLFEGKWRYIPEVSFDMGHSPPKPILAKHQLFPPNYPYWGIPRKGTRRPDVAIIDGEDNHGLEQKNIIRLVEIKFGKDTLKPGQRRSYEIIAGNRSKVSVISENDCDCKDDQDDDKDKKNTSLSPVVVPETNVVDTWDELFKGLQDKKLPIYAPKPHPPARPIVPKPKPKPKPKPVIAKSGYSRNSNYGYVPSKGQTLPMYSRPSGVPANAIVAENKESGGYDWVIPTIVAGAVVAVVVVAYATGVGEVATVLSITGRFAIAGAQRLALRYGVSVAGLAIAGTATAKSYDPHGQLPQR